MPLPPSLPAALLTELGKLTVVWAHLEQDIILHASAMAAQETDGVPMEHLRMDFKRLREKWYSLCKARFDTEIINRVVNPLNSGLARYALERGSMIHGLWSPLADSRFKLWYFEQKTSLDSYHSEHTLQEVREAVSAHQSLGTEVNHFCTGKHTCFKNLEGTVAKVGAPFMPPNERGFRSG